MNNEDFELRQDKRLFVIILFTMLLCIGKQKLLLSLDRLFIYNLILIFIVYGLSLGKKSLPDTASKQLYIELCSGTLKRISRRLIFISVTFVASADMTLDAFGDNPTDVPS